MTLIGVHEMHGRVDPNNIINVMCALDPLSSLMTEVSGKSFIVKKVISWFM